MHTNNEDIHTASTITHRTACSHSAVSWSAILAGAVAAAVLSLILLILGTGLGFAAMSPWGNEGLSAQTIGFSTIAWITFMSIVASGLGGYIAGRLRTRWTALNQDEVYFRDTAHGFLAWGLATLLTATLLASAVSSVVGGGLKVGAAAIGTAAAATTAAVSSASDDSNSPLSYLWDSLLRKQPGFEPTKTSENTKREIAGIFANAIRTQSLPDADVRYLVRIVAENTGISEQEANARINDAYNKLREAEVAAKEAADKAASASAYAALWLFISLLIGAFVASLMATYGGRRRDLY